MASYVACSIECRYMQCRVTGCERTDSTSKDLCAKHYAQIRRTGSIIDGYGPRGQICDCGIKAVARGMCQKHYARWRKVNNPKVAAERATRRRWGTEQCEVDGCSSPHLARGLCASHYRKQPDRRKRGREKAHRRRIRKRSSAIVWPIPEDKIQARIDFYGGCCYICGSPNADTIDHVKPIAKGGAHIPANLRPACLSCNSSKRDAWQGVI